MPESASQEFIDKACAALRSGVRLRIADRRGKIYGVEDFRIVEVHAVGHSAHGDYSVARVWDVARFGIPRSESRWELLHFANVVECKLTDEKSRAPRPGYKRNDPDIKEILCQV